ncbi:VapE domain-containing protein [Comamonas odontotermitis]|uniref:VapE domain-containing protein n=1 Tax=Comamonas odontotermitis TaxID=379895 RepID=UPI001CC51F23|nr:VapE domain-containing protein [Comamonas odontotermitis]UBB19514.1 virulence protein E [Comamonas odontotermitis]
MTHREELPPLKYRELAEALLDRIDELVPRWLPGGRREGHEWKCSDLGGGSGSSCSVCMEGSRAGRWADFSGDEKGRDLLSLYAAIHNLSIGKAAIQVAREEGLEAVAGVVKTAAGAPVQPAANPRPAAPAKPKPVKENWTPIVPVPDYAPPTDNVHFDRGQGLHVAEYRYGDDLMGYVVRFVKSDGSKVDIPHVFASSDKKNGAKWVWRHWDEPKPLFLPLAQFPRADQTVVIVEGEIKAILLQKTLDSFAPGVYLVLSWAGGCKGWAKGDWGRLRDLTVLLWPDCDSQRHLPSKKELSACATEEEREALKNAQPYLKPDKQPGVKAMLGIGRLLREQGCDVKLLPIPFPGVKPSGYDCKDYIETEGWTGEHIVTSFFGKAYPPGWDAEDQSAAPEEKREAPVGTGGDGGNGGGKGKKPTAAAADDGDGSMPTWLEPYYEWKRGRWNLCRSLVVDALRRDPALQGCVAYNELTKEQDVRKPWPWSDQARDDWSEGSADLLARYLTDRYGVGDVAVTTVQDAIRVVGYAERFHPVREYLQGLVWDKKPRLSKWLVFVLGETPATLNPALYEYLSLVGRFWLQGMVWRVMEPGCKFDYMPVLEGVGGLGKSTLARLLCALPKWFGDSKFDLERGKEALELVRGKWLYEIGELSSFSKAGVNDIKAFISSMIDTFRPSYEPKARDFPRQVVLVGTTNDDKYLRDRTGNRRFWPVPVRHEIKLAWLERWRDQLFAEAYQLYLEKAEYHPSKEVEARLFVPMQESRLVESAIDGELLTLLTRPPGQDTNLINCDTQRVPLTSLVKALHVDAGKSTRVLEQQIQGWLASNGWVNKGRQRIDGQLKASVYFRPEVWPPEEVKNTMTWAESDDDKAQKADAQPGAVDAPVSMADQVKHWLGDMDAPF